MHDGAIFTDMVKNTLFSACDAAADASNLVWSDIPGCIEKVEVIDDALVCSTINVDPELGM